MYHSPEGRTISLLSGSGSLSLETGSSPSSDLLSSFISTSSSGFFLSLSVSSFSLSPFLSFHLSPILSGSSVYSSSSLLVLLRLRLLGVCSLVFLGVFLGGIFEAFNVVCLEFQVRLGCLSENLLNITKTGVSLTTMSYNTNNTIERTSNSVSSFCHPIVVASYLSPLYAFL